MDFLSLNESLVGCMYQFWNHVDHLLTNSHFCFTSVSRHRTLMNIFDKAPVVDKDAFVAPSASIIGDVQVGRGSSIWYGCVLRGNAGLHFH